VATTGDAVSALGGPPQSRADQADRLVEAWLVELAAGLRGPARARAPVVAELRDGLLEAVDSYRADGLAPAEAARAAVREFGEPAAIATEFVAELAAREARRIALALIGTGPLVGLLWGAAMASSHLLAHPVQPGPPWTWPQLPVALRVASALLAAVLVVGVPAGMFVVAATGRISRWLPRPARHARLAPTAAATLGVAALAADVIVLTTVSVMAIVMPGRLVWAPVTVAALASLTRLVVNTRATRHLLATRAALA
jgi:hypothetical protein